MQSTGAWSNFIEHEIAHVLGFGTMWSRNSLHSGLTSDDNYRGQYAQQEWERLGCSGDLPIETDGGLGTAGGHWDEQCLAGELMTGFTNTDMRLSRITIAAFKDLGYGVNMDAADDFTLDDLGSCGSYCPEARRKLRGSRQNGRKLRTEISDEGKQKVLQAAATTLREQRAAGTIDELPGDDGVSVTAPGEFITIFIRDIDDEIKEATITWNDVLAISDDQEDTGTQDSNIFSN